MVCLRGQCFRKVVEKTWSAFLLTSDVLALGVRGILHNRCKDYHDNWNHPRTGGMKPNLMAFVGSFYQRLSKYSVNLRCRDCSVI